MPEDKMNECRGRLCDETTCNGYFRHFISYLETTLGCHTGASPGPCAKEIESFWKLDGSWAGARKLMMLLRLMKMMRLYAVEP